MTTLEQSQQTDWLQTELESMSSQADSPAKTSQSQATKQASQTERVADYGQSAPVLLGKFDPNTPSLKTSQTCLMENGELGLSEFSGTFPRSGMMRSGTVYQLPNLARTTTEIGSGSSLTLKEFSRTPDTGGGGTPKALLEGKTHRESGSAIQIRLADQVKMWPTPNASDNRDRGCMEDPSVQRVGVSGEIALSFRANSHVSNEEVRLLSTAWLVGLFSDTVVENLSL